MHRSYHVDLQGPDVASSLDGSYIESEESKNAENINEGEPAFTGHVPIFRANDNDIK